MSENELMSSLQFNICNIILTLKVQQRSSVIWVNKSTLLTVHIHLVDHSQSKEPLYSLSEF